MTFDLILQNLLAGVRTVRFILGFLIVASLFAVSAATFLNRLNQDSADYHQQQIHVQDDIMAASAHLNQFAMGDVQVVCPPSPLQFISTGSDDRLPNTAMVGVFRISNIDNMSRSNPLLPGYNVFDWTFIIGTILSFLALMLTYDAISGEKEDGTLRFILSNAVPRYRLLAGKFIAAMLLLLIPFLAGALMNLIVLSFSHVLVFTAETIFQILMVVAVSMLYLSVFVALGLVVSSVARSSAVSLVICLVLWVIIVLVIPNLGGLMAQSLSPLEPARDVQANIKLATDDLFKTSPPDVWSCFGSDATAPCYRHKADMWNKREELQMKIWDEHRSRQLAQVALGRRLIRISPTALYQDAVAAIADLGIDRYINFQRQMLGYRETLKEFIRVKDAADTASAHLINPQDRWVFSSRPLAHGEIPGFSYRQPSLDILLTDAAGNIAGLLVFNIIFLGLGVILFNRYDVR